MERSFNKSKWHSSHDDYPKSEWKSVKLERSDGNNKTRSRSPSKSRHSHHSRSNGAERSKIKHRRQSKSHNSSHRTDRSGRSHWHDRSRSKSGSHRSRSNEVERWKTEHRSRRNRSSRSHLRERSVGKNRDRPKSRNRHISSQRSDRSDSKNRSRSKRRYSRSRRSKRSDSSRSYGSKRSGSYDKNQDRYHHRKAQTSSNRHRIDEVDRRREKGRNDPYDFVKKYFGLEIKKEPGTSNEQLQPQRQEMRIKKDWTSTMPQMPIQTKQPSQMDLFNCLDGNRPGPIITHQSSNTGNVNPQQARTTANRQLSLSEIDKEFHRIRMIETAGRECNCEIEKTLFFLFKMLKNCHETLLSQNANNDSANTVNNTSRSNCRCSHIITSETISTQTEISNNISQTNNLMMTTLKPEDNDENDEETSTSGLNEQQELLNSNWMSYQKNEMEMSEGNEEKFMESNEQQIQNLIRVSGQEVRACNIKLRRYLPSRAVKNKVTSGVIVKQRRHERVDSEWTIKKRFPQDGKPQSNGPQDRKPVPRSNASTFTIQTCSSSTTIKNSNADWHSLSTDKSCKICGIKLGVKSLIKHYVGVHPNREVFSSRLSPHSATLLRNSTNIDQCNTIFSRDSRSRPIYKQLCYFCNQFKCYRKDSWIYHLITHTGYYKYQCNDCMNIFSEKSDHGCTGEYIIRRSSSLFQFAEDNIIAYLCDLCNYVRFTEEEIEKHLIWEHEGDVNKKFKEFIFLRFPKAENNHSITQSAANNHTINRSAANNLSVTQSWIKDEEIAEALQNIDRAIESLSSTMNEN